MTILECWLRRFANGAAPLYQWERRWQLVHGTPRQCLRAVLPVPLTPPAEACPLVMQELHDGWPSELGKDMLTIVAAADGDPQADPVVWKQLDAICGIEEQDACRVC